MNKQTNTKLVMNMGVEENVTCCHCEVNGMAAPHKGDAAQIPLSTYAGDNVCLCSC